MLKNSKIKKKKLKKRLSFDQRIKIQLNQSESNRIDSIQNSIRFGFDSIRIQIRFDSDSIQIRFDSDSDSIRFDSKINRPNPNRIRIEFNQIRIRFEFSLNRIESNRIRIESESNSNFRIFCRTLIL